MKNFISLLQTILTSIRGILRFYPFQLPFFQLRRHPFLMLVWLFFWGMGLGFLGQGLGVEQIFFSPGEGMSQPYWGTFAWGIAFGLFTTAYHLSTFLLDGHHASFLLRAGKNIIFLYALNNSLLPLAFLLFFLAKYNGMHALSETVIMEVVAILFGVMLVWALALLYFSRWRLSLRAYRYQRSLVFGQETSMQAGLWLSASARRVWYYLALPEGILPVETRLPNALMLRLMERILTRGHAAALIFESLVILLVLIWGYVQGVSDWYPPASAVVLVVGAGLFMLVGAIDYWLKRIGGWMVIVLGIASVALWFFWKGRALGSEAFGLSYDRTWPYKVPVWDVEMAQRFSEDSALVATILERRLHQMEVDKPALIWVTVSGGGWRSAYWTFLNLHLLDSLSGGRFYRHLGGITGASGGLIGAAFWRELHLFAPERLGRSEEADSLTQDLLNPIFANGLLGLLSPTLRWYDSVTHRTYIKGRDYAFETQLIRNARAFSGRRLRDYAPYEREGRVPLIILTPACLTNSLQLLISPLPLSFLCWSGRRPVGIELRTLVPAGDMHFTTALRMNAAFPFVLPAVRLPTDPPLEVIDAGAIDNLGESLTLRLLWHQRAVLQRAASKLIWIEIRDLPPGGGQAISEGSPLDALKQKLGGLYSAFSESRYHFTAMTLVVLKSTYKIPIEKHTLYYSPGPEGYTPPLGFTLLAPDRLRLREAVYSEGHQARLRLLLDRMGL